MSWRAGVRASAALLVAGACKGDQTMPLGLHRAQLLALARSAAAEPPPAAFSFPNNRLTTFSIRHTDTTHTLYAQFTFTPLSVVSRNDTILADTSTVSISVSITPGLYDLNVAPSTLGFNIAGGPTVTLSYGIYGDLSVFDSSAKYPSAAAFEQALELWREVAPDSWVPTRNSAHTGPSTISSALESPGTYLVAAPK